MHINLFKRYGILTDTSQISAPYYDNVHVHVNYPQDGRVHQTARCYKNRELIKEIYQNLYQKIYTVLNGNKEKIATYKLDEQFEEVGYFGAGGSTVGLGLNEYENNKDRQYKLWQCGTSITEGFFFILQEPFDEDKLDYEQDLIID